MVASRSVPQHTEQMLSPRAGQNLLTLRLWQIGQGNCGSLLLAVRRRRESNPELCHNFSRCGRVARARVVREFDSPHSRAAAPLPRLW